MSVTPFVTLVRREVEEIRQNYPGLSNEGDAFAVWCVHFLHGLPLDEAVEWATTGGKGAGDGGVDAMIVDEADGVVYLLQTKFAEDSTATFDATPLSELRTGLSRVLSPIYSEQIGDNFAKKAELVRAALAGDADLVLQVVVFGQASPSLVTAAQALAEEPADFQTQADVWDLGRLDREWTDRETVRDLRGTDVSFQTVGARLEVPSVSVSGLKSYGVVVLEGRSLALAAKEYGPRLVDMNVRYQLRRTKINDSIAETATQPDKQARFLVLNNGLTVVCDRIVSESEDEIVLSNPQIVNGAQTALTIGDNVDKIPEGTVQVLARVMEVDKSVEIGAALARQISEATNRQNPVSSADLKAHDPLQIRIESDLKKLQPAWYYERRRNSWASLGDAEKKSYAGVISKEDLGQRYRAMMGEPAKAITAKSTIFDSTSLYGTVFDADTPVERYVLAHQLFDFYHSLLNKPKVALREAIYEDFDEDTRQLLMRARNQFASHATALAYFLLGRRYKTLDASREYTIAIDARSGGADYLPMHKLVVMTLIKWARSKHDAAVESGEAFNIKDEFENAQAYLVLREDAKMAAQFFKQQTLDLLPG